MFSKLLTLITFLTLLLPTISATTCQPQTSGLHSPLPNTTLTLNQPFNLTFCSFAYFKTRTIDIDVVVWRCGPNAGDACSEFILGEEIVHAQKTNAGEQYGYEFNATVLSGGGARTGQWAVGVLEHTTGYYVQYSIVKAFVPVTFVAG